MAKARKGSLTKSNLMMLLFGKQFTGKSTLALQLMYYKYKNRPFRVLYLDGESGSVDDYLEDLEKDGINLDNLYIVYTQSLAETRNYIAKVKNNEDIYELDPDTGEETDKVLLDADGKPFRADAIVVDGTSILNLTTKQGLIEFSKKRNRIKADKAGLIGDEKAVKIDGAGLEFKDYQTVNFKGQDLILDLLASGVHCIVTAREADEKETIVIDGKKESVSTGRKIPDGFKGMEYNVKTVIRTYNDEENNIICAKVEKDRTHVHEGGTVLENPTILDWMQVIDKNSNRSDFVIKNDLTKAVETEQDLYTKETLKSSDIEKNSLDKKDNLNIDIDSIRKQINEYIKNIPPIEKKKAKALLEENKLPTNISKIDDINILEEIKKVLGV